MVDPVVNKGKVTVPTGYNNTATSIVLATGQGAELPDPVVDGAYNLPWWDSTNYNDPADDPNYEIVRVTGPAGTGDTKTIVRAQEGTAATNKNNADATYKMHLGVTAKTITDLIADVEKAATVIVGKAGHVDYLTTDYGSDDACIQAAIDYVNGLTEGGNVLIREGTYTLANNIRIKQNVFVIGTGIGTVFTQANGANLTKLVQIGGASGAVSYNFGISKIKLHGNKANNTGTKLIEVLSAEYVYIDNMYFVQAPSYSILLSGASGLLSKFIFISTCHFNNSDAHAIEIDIYAWDVKISLCDIATISGAGIHSVSGETIITTCEIWECTYGIYLYGPVTTTISNCLILTSDSQGIRIDGGSQVSRRVTISNNFLGNNGMDTADTYDDIFINNSNDCIVSNNMIKSSQSRHNIRLGDNTTGTTASDNQVLDSDSARINNTGTNRIIDNYGFNPVGNFTAPSVPATTVNYTNNYGYPCQVQVYGGTVTEIDIDDIATGLTSGIFIIPPGETINITYSAAPSWRWWGL